MDLNEYQAKAALTAIYPEGVGSLIADARRQHASSYLARLLELSYVSLGLAGEAGEFANKVSKIIRDNPGVITMGNKLKLIDELGDALWFLSEAARILGVDLEIVADDNLSKLANRAESGTIKGSGDER